jgi:hypothetical protein
MKLTKTGKPFKSNLEPWLNRPLPPGKRSDVYRVQAEAGVLATWASMKPAERGEHLARTLKRE